MVGEGNLASDFNETSFLSLRRQQQEAVSDSCIQIHMRACNHIIHANPQSGTYNCRCTLRCIHTQTHSLRDTPTVILGCILTQRKPHLDPHAGKVHKLSHTLYSHTLHRHTRTYSETHRKTVSHTGFKSEFGLKALTCAKPRAQYMATPSPLACNPCDQRPLSFHRGKRKNWCGGHWRLNSGAGEVGETSSWRGSLCNPAPHMGSSSKRGLKRGRDGRGASGGG